MDANHHYILQPAYPSSQTTPSILLSMDRASLAVHPGVPYTVQPTHSASQATPSVPPSTVNAYPAALSGALLPYAGYNHNWGPEQAHQLLQLATSMTGGPSMSRLAAPNNDDYQCLWVINGIPCPHVCIDFDELMVHLGRVHDVQGTASRRIVCQRLTERGSCGMKYRRDGFRRHIGTHVRLSVACKQCGKSFSREDTLRAHIKKCSQKQS